MVHPASGYMVGALLRRAPTLAKELASALSVRPALDSASLARKGWELAQQKIIANQVQVLVLDEFTYPMVFGWIAVDEVVDWLRQNKPKDLHIVITGRDAPQELIDFADLVTEMKLIKHPYEDQNIKAQPGIEF